MKKWNEYTKREKTMVIVVVALFVAVLLSWGRVQDDFKKGAKIFYGTSADSLQTGH